MRVAILGATGSTGSLAMEKLLAKGHQVVAVSRQPLSRDASLPRVVSKVGDLTDADSLGDAVADCAAVISCLGQKRASRGLFARRTSPPDILQRVAGATVEAIGGGRQNLICMSVFGVGADRRRHALLFRIILRLSTIHEAYLDHAEAEARIARSSVRWTIVRPPGLSDGRRAATSPTPTCR